MAASCFIMMVRSARCTGMCCSQSCGPLLASRMAWIVIVVQEERAAEEARRLQEQAEEVREHRRHLGFKVLPPSRMILLLSFQKSRHDRNRDVRRASTPRPRCYSCLPAGSCLPVTPV